MVTRFLFGLTLPFRAARTIIRHRSLLFWSMFPSLITATLYFFALQKALDWAKGLFHGLLAKWGIAPEGWLGWTLGGLTAIVLILVGVLTFTIVSSLVAAPFNDFLAEKTEPHALPPLSPVEVRGWGHRVRLIWIDLVKTLAAGMMGIVALLVSWIPIVNIVGFTLAWLLIAFQFVSYAQTRRGISLVSSLFFLLRNFAACLGFGISISVLFAVPFLSILVLPVAVVGGTLLYAGMQPRLAPPV